MQRTRPCPATCNILLIGGGGREHALAWKLRRSPRLGELWITDAANAALASLGRRCPQPMDLSNAYLMRRWCQQNHIDLVVVGPESPLAAGIVDVLQSEQCLVFGPNKAAAQLEADKGFAKKLMRQAAIPTAETRIFGEAHAAMEYVRAHDEPCVVKAAGLAAGKGAIVCNTQDEALDAVKRIMIDHEFGDAGKSILIEEKLAGQEVSVLALVDGRTFWILDPCQDHKQLGEGDTGPNTGGMGAYCPTPLIDMSTIAQIERQVFVPTVDALRRQGIEYRGVLYAGLMLTPAGPKVLEFNCRFGDPECQPLMARLRSDLIRVLWASCNGTLDQIEIEFEPRVACCVVMCAAGYPGAFEKGKVIAGIEDAEALGGDTHDVIVFHAGTTRDRLGQLVTNAGRVLGVTALGDDLAAARDLANAACERIHFDGAYFRRDIGDRVLVRT